MKKIVSLLCVLFLLASMTSCNSNQDVENEKPREIYAGEAISTAKNSGLLRARIVDACGLKFSYAPEWGVCAYERDEDNNWIVNLKGTISGYSDEYKSDYKSNLKFEAYVKLTPGGNIISISAKRVY